jgi:hopanoid biosynthesis associated RND transporter like protein HpnN
MTVPNPPPSEHPKESVRWTRKLLVGTVMFSRRRYVFVIALALLLALGSLGLIVNNFKINTDTTRLLFKHGSFTRLNNRLARDFPSLSSRIIIVVHSGEPSTTVDAVTDIVHVLKRHPRSYPFVYAPNAEPLFQRDGLLFLSRPRLRSVLQSVAQAEPFLGAVLNHPNVKGYALFLGEIIQHLHHLPQGEQPLLVSILKQNVALVSGRSPSSKTGLHFEKAFLGRSLATFSTETAEVIVSLPHGSGTARHARRAVQRLRLLLSNDHALARTGAHWALTGSVVLGLDQLRAVTSGTQLATVLSIVFSMALLILGLRSARLLLPILITLLMGLLYTAAFALGVLGPLNLISVAFGVLFIGLGVDFSIQFCIRLQEELAKQSDPNMAFSATAYRIGFALVIAAVAAASCFYAVIPTGYSGIRDLGIIAGTGALVALVLNLTLLPALLTLFRAGRITIARPPVPFAKLPVQKMGRPVLMFSLFMIALSLFLIPRLSFDFDLAHLENRDSVAYRVLHKLEKKLTFSPYTLEAIAPNLNQAARWATDLHRLPSVGRVLTLRSYIPSNQKTKIAMISNTALLYPPFVSAPARITLGRNVPHDCQLLSRLGREAGRHAAEAPTPLKDVLLRFSNAFNRAFGTRCSRTAMASLNQGAIAPLVGLGVKVVRLLNPTPVTVQSLPATLRRNYLAVNGHARVEIFSRLNLHHARNLQEFVDQVTRVIPNVGGTPVLFVRGGQIVTAAFRQASLLAFLFIVVVVCIVLRNIRDVALTLVPLVLSVSLTLSTLALLGVRFNLANIIVIPLSIGLSVAFGIYMILRWKNNHYDIRQVLRSSVPEGIMVSGMTTLVVFGTLVLTPSPGLYSLGTTLLIALFWTLVSSLVILPCILFVVETSLHRVSTRT